MSDKIINDVSPKHVQVGDIMAFHFYVEVKHKKNELGSTVLQVKNIENEQIMDVSGNDIIKQGFSGDQFIDTITLSRTKIIGIIKDSPNRPIQIEFVKKDGSERNIICRLIHLTDTGYAMVDELNGDTIKPKQVDLRTIQWIVVDGTKYIVK